MVSAAHQESIATTILDQLACTSGGTGINRLRAMVEATNIVTLIAGATSEVVPPHSLGIGFRFRGCKDWNGVEIFLDQGRDTYILRFLPDAVGGRCRHSPHAGAVGSMTSTPVN